MGRATHRDAEGRGGRGLHGGVPVGDPAGHAAPLPTALRGGLCGRDREHTQLHTHRQPGNSPGTPAGRAKRGSFLRGALANKPMPPPAGSARVPTAA